MKGTKIETMTKFDCELIRNFPITTKEDETKKN